MKGQYFYVHDTPHDNYWSAIRHAKQVNAWMETKVSDFHRSQWESVDVQHVVGKSVTHWIDKKMHWLFENFNNMRLFYSGGTDSQTIMDRAIKHGYKWHNTHIFGTSITSDHRPLTNEEINPALDWIVANPHASNHFEVFHPNLQLLENWLDPEFPFLVPRMHMSFAVRDRIFSTAQWQYKTIDASISGHAKPNLFKDRSNNWYWFQTHGMCDGTASQPNHIAFYIDGFCPEVAISQVYALKNYFETNHPTRTGWCSFANVANSKKEDLNRALGRTPALTYKIGAGLLGKGEHSQNAKHLRLLEEVKQKNRQDLILAWQKQCQRMVHQFRDVPGAIHVHNLPDPLDQNKTMEFPGHVERIQWAYKLESDRVVPVDHTEIIERYNMDL